MKRYSISCQNFAVAAPPKLTFDGRYENLRVPVDGTIKISVNMDADPVPSVTWYKDGRLLLSSRHVTVDTDEYMSTLVMRRITRDDSGDYKILAKNEWGTSEVDFSIFVTGARVFVCRVVTCTRVSTSCCDTCVFL